MSSAVKEAVLIVEDDQDDAISEAIAKPPAVREAVLIVEDDEDAAMLERRTLEQHGFEVVSVETPLGALAALRSRSFDLIVADYRLGKETGLELFEQIQALGYDVPVIMVTGFSSEDTVIEAIRRGVRDFVPKSDEYLRYLPDAIKRVLKGIRTERQLAKSEARFQLFMDNTPAIAFLKDEQGRLLYANHRYEEECGQKSILGKTDADLWQSSTADQLGENDSEALLAGRPLQFEETLVRSDGMLRQWLTYRFPLLESTGSCLLGGMAVNVTEQRNAEEALRERDEQLRQAQKMEAVGKLAGGVAHDFNNMLTIILGYAEILQESFREGDPVRESVEQIHRAGSQAAGLTRQLLAFSRKQVLMPVNLDLNSLLADVEKMLGRVIGEDVDLTFRPADNLWRVRVDAGQMEQVIMNLVVNARDAMPQGGKLTIETANVELDEQYAAGQSEARTGEHILLAISDSGCGMDKATLARIFEPFFSTKGEMGTGLGLATVYGIVKQSGGHVAVYSEPQRGTTFKIYLPRDLEGISTIQSPTDSQARRRGTETVLLVEDEEGVRSLARVALQRQGYKILEAQHGGEALLICEQYKDIIHLLATDVVMPQMSGRDLAERLLVLRPAMKVLYTSGYMDDAIVRHGLINAGVPFLQKPYTPNAIARKVREVLDSPRT